MCWSLWARFESKTCKFSMMYNLSSPKDPEAFDHIAFFPIEWSSSPIPLLLVGNRMWMLCFLRHLWDLFMSHSWMRPVLYGCKQTYIKEESVHYLDRYVSVRIRENSHPGWDMCSATLLETPARHCEMYNHSISNDLEMCLPPVTYTLWKWNKLVLEILVISV